MKDVIADALLYTIIIVLAATAGMQYQAHRHAQADKAELQDLQRRAAANAAWLRGERKASEERLNQHIATLTPSSLKPKEKPMKTIKLMLLACVLALSACASPSCPPAAPATAFAPPEIPPLQLQPRTPNLTQRQQQILQPSPTKVMPPSASSTPALPSTTP